MSTPSIQRAVLDVEMKAQLESARGTSANDATVVADLTALRTAIIAIATAVDAIAVKVNSIGADVNTDMAKINASTVIGLAQDYKVTTVVNAATNLAAGAGTPPALTTT